MVVEIFVLRPKVEVEVWFRRVRVRMYGEPDEEGEDELVEGGRGEGGDQVRFTVWEVVRFERGVVKSAVAGRRARRESRMVALRRRVVIVEVWDRCVDHIWFVRGLR